MDKVEQAVEVYLAKLYRLRSTGGATAETSFYSSLEELLNQLGEDLRPKVFCLSQLADQGAGHPDFGLFTAAQCQRGQPRPGALPERGVVEVKAVGEDAWFTAQTAQVSKYWGRYRFVLVTNFRSFLMLVSVREDVESVESCVIPWRRTDVQEAADVDAGEPSPLRPQQAALPERSDR